MEKNLSIDELNKLQKKRARSTAIVLAAATFMSVIFFVYAVIQKLEADRQTELARVNERLANEQRALAQTQMDESRKAMEALMQQKVALEQLLQNCKGSK